MTLTGEALPGALAALLASHDLPSGEAEPDRPAETETACVHFGAYGTRSSQIVIVPPSGAPRVWFADGPPCVTRFADAGFGRAAPLIL